MPRYDFLLVQTRKNYRFHRGDNMGWAISENSKRDWLPFYLKIYWERK